MEVLENTTLPRHEVYRDSGFEWLGSIPKHWNLQRLGIKFHERKQKVSDKEYSPLSVTKNGILPQLDNAAKTNDGDNRKLVRRGDFVINSRSDRKGSSGLSDLEGSVSLINIVLIPTNIDKRYSALLLKSYGFVEEYYRNGHGIVADLWTTRYDEMKSIMIPIPPLPEQTRIANFLDKKTAQIDQAIAQKERLIELLKERRQVMIHKAITCGLDENGKLREKPGCLPAEGWKDSGVEWIGKIPEHWEVKKLKYLVKIIDCKHITPRYSETGFPVVSTGNVKPFQLTLDSARFVSMKDYRTLTEDGRLPTQGDIIYSRNASVGAAAKVRIETKFCLGQDVCLMRSEIDGEYLEIILNSLFVMIQLERQIQGSTFNRINISQIKEFYLPICEPLEMNQLKTFIINQSNKVHQTILIQKDQIEKLRELKTSLIHDVVRGKVRVT